LIEANEGTIVLHDLLLVQYVNVLVFAACAMQRRFQQQPDSAIY